MGILATENCNEYTLQSKKRYLFCFIESDGVTYFWGVCIKLIKIQGDVFNFSLENTRKSCYNTSRQSIE